MASDEQRFAEHLRRLEHSTDDRHVRRQLRQRAATGLAGNPIPRYVYRLECGHLEQIHGHPLPSSTSRLYCGKPGCYRERAILENLTR